MIWERLTSLVLFTSYTGLHSPYVGPTYPLLLNHVQRAMIAQQETMQVVTFIQAHKDINKFPAWVNL